MRSIARTAVVVAGLALCAGAARAQTAEEIADKSVAAVGGRAALEKITSRSTTGTMLVEVEAGSFTGSVEVLNQAPNKSRTLISLDLSAAGAGTVVIDQRFDGTTGYVMDGLRGNSEMPAAQVQSQRNNIFPSPLLDYKDRGAKLELAGKDKAGDRDAFVLTLTPASGAPTRVFVDAETYMPLQAVTRLEVPEIGSLEQTVQFSDYREVDGIKVPFKLRGSSSVQTFTITVSKVEHNVKIDPALFAKPAEK
jgi:outer membrane lipoprotein-sorting protein